MTAAGAISPRIAAIKMATRRAVEAAGGQALVAAAVDRAQSRISDYCSLNNPDCAPIDIAIAIDAVAAAAADITPICDLLVRLMEGDSGTGSDDLAAHLPIIAAESADLIREMASRGARPLSVNDISRLITESEELRQAINNFILSLADDGGAA